MYEQNSYFFCSSKKTAQPIMVCICGHGFFKTCFDGAGGRLHTSLPLRPILMFTLDALVNVAAQQGYTVKLSFKRVA